MIDNKFDMIDANKTNDTTKNLLAFAVAKLKKITFPHGGTRQSEVGITVFWRD